MARDFNGTDQFLGRTGAVAGVEPLTMAGWFSCDQNTAIQGIVSQGRNSTSSGWLGLWVRGDLAGKNVSAGKQQNTSGAAHSLSLTAYTVGQWHHVAGVYPATNSRTVYLDGVAGNTETTNLASASAGRTAIGALYKNVGSNFFDGRVAEVGIWNVALTAVEITALSRGVSPRRIRPESLVGYWPVWGLSSPEPAFMSGALNMTLFGATEPAQANHPPVTMSFGSGFCPIDLPPVPVGVYRYAGFMINQGRFIGR